MHLIQVPYEALRFFTKLFINPIRLPGQIVLNAYADISVSDRPTSLTHLLTVTNRSKLPLGSDSGRMPGCFQRMHEVQLFREIALQRLCAKLVLLPQFLKFTHHRLLFEVDSVSNLLGLDHDLQSFLLLFLEFQEIYVQLLVLLLSNLMSLLKSQLFMHTHLLSFLFLIFNHVLDIFQLLVLEELRRLFFAGGSLLYLLHLLKDTHCLLFVKKLLHHFLIQLFLPKLDQPVLLFLQLLELFQFGIRGD